MQNTFLIKTRNIRRELIGILFLLLSLSLANFVYAQSDKPLTLVVPFPPVVVPISRRALSKLSSQSALDVQL